MNQQAAGGTVPTPVGEAQDPAGAGPGTTRDGDARIAQVHRGRTPTRVGITRSGGAYHAVALQAVRPGEPLLEIVGVVVDRPSRHSVQVDRGLHVVPPAGLAPDDGGEPYRWRYLNYSCRPNAAFHGRTLVAVAPIAQGEEVTFDYNTTELEVGRPFECRCGHCDGQIVRGFRHLSPGEQRRREPFLASHLRALLGGH